MSRPECKQAVTVDALILACNHGWLASVKLLVKCNRECINERATTTPLHAGVQSRSVDCVDFLLTSGADPSLKDVSLVPLSLQRFSFAL